MSTSLLIVLSVAEAVLVIVVLALALIEIRRRLNRIADGLGTLGSALETVESEHLRPLRPAVILRSSRITPTRKTTSARMIRRMARTVTTAAASIAQASSRIVSSEPP